MLSRASTRKPSQKKEQNEDVADGGRVPQALHSGFQVAREEKETDGRMEGGLTTASGAAEGRSDVGVSPDVSFGWQPTQI